MHAHVLSRFSRVQLLEESPSGSSVHESLQARIPEWAAIPFSRGSSHPKGKTLISCVSSTGRHVLPSSPVSPALAGTFSTSSATWEACLKFLEVGENYFPAS